MVVAASIVCLVRHDFKRLIIFFRFGTAWSVHSVFSVLIHSWSQVVEFPVISGFFDQFNFALANPNPAFAAILAFRIGRLLAAAIWQLFRSRSETKRLTDVFLFRLAHRCRSAGRLLCVSGNAQRSRAFVYFLCVVACSPSR